MSFWYSSQKQREMHQMKQRYLSNILQYNKQQIEDKQRRKRTESKSFTEHSYLSNQQAINDLLTETDRTLRRKEEEKNMLKQSYDRQIYERREKLKQQKQKDLVYAHRQRERLDYEQERRLFQLSKMFNRVTYQGTPSNNHRRSKTQSYDRDFEVNPQKKQQQNAHIPKNLDHIEISILPPQNSLNNLGQRRQQGDSLDNLNYSFHNKGNPTKY